MYPLAPSVSRITPGTIVPKSKSKCGLVLVTGGSGYIAGYCVAQLLNDGWSVRTTVRSLAKTKAVRASIDNLAPKASEIEFVEADLNSDAGWVEPPWARSMFCTSLRLFR